MQFIIVLSAIEETVVRLEVSLVVITILFFCLLVGSGVF